jgi:hypothetical protein
MYYECMLNRGFLKASGRAMALVLALLPLAVHAQVIFNDNFNGTNVATNNGTGSINPTGNTTAFIAGGDSGTVSQNGNGALFTPGGGYGFQNLVSDTGNTDGNTAYALGPVGTSFQVTVNNVSVSANGGDNRPDIPNSQNGGFRYELGIVSATVGGGDPELYQTTGGGLYVNLFYDTNGNLTGDLRLTDHTKGNGYDSSGLPGITELASFTLPDTISPLTVSFILTSTGYDVVFDKPVDVSSGSLAGTFAFPGDFASGVQASLFAQGWSNGDGAGNISEFEVRTVPEPSVVYLLGLGAAALLVVGYRRRISQRASL